MLFELRRIKKTVRVKSERERAAGVRESSRQKKKEKVKSFFSDKYREPVAAAIKKK